jgi:hypothetical protein
MGRHRALAGLVLAVMLALLQPASAVAAPPPERIQAVQLTSPICPWADGESKVVSTLLLGNRVLTPYFLFVEGTWRGVLMPYRVTASGEGLKARHLIPDVYIRPGRAPKELVTCEFTGSTPDGDVNLVVEGTAIKLPRFSRPR